MKKQSLKFLDKEIINREIIMRHTRKRLENAVNLKMRKSETGKLVEYNAGDVLCI